MRIHREGREIHRVVAILVHVAAHEHGPLRSERRAMHAFPIGVASQREASLQPPIKHVGHFFDAGNCHQIVGAAGDGQVGLPQCDTARRASRIDRAGFDAWQAKSGSNCRAHLTLDLQCTAQSIRHIQRLHALGRDTAQCRRKCLARKIAGGALPMLGNSRLPSADDIYRLHTVVLLYSITSLPRHFAYTA